MENKNTYGVTPARDPALREPKAGVQSEKAGFPLPGLLPNSGDALYYIL